MLIQGLPILEDLPIALQVILSRALFLLFTVFLIIIIRRIIKMILIRPIRRWDERVPHLDAQLILDKMMLPVRFLAIALAIGISGEIFAVGDSIDSFISNVARTFLILTFLVAAYRIIDLLMPSSVHLSDITGIEMEERLIPFFRTAVKLVIIVLGVFIVLGEWDYDITGLIAGFGLGGLALSLAAQDTAANLFGFMALVSDNPFNVGEFIITPDAEGIVEHVGLRTTRIRRLDQAVIYVPNSRMANSSIINWSRLEKRRLDYTLTVTYSTSAGEMRVLLHRLREMLKSQEKVDPDSVVVYFMDFGSSSLDILVRCFIHITDWGEFQAEKERLHLEVMNIVNDLGLDFAFPSMSLYVENIPPVSAPEDVVAPRLSRRERALKEGRIIETPSRAKTSDDPEENITGQQDEDEDTS